MVSARSSQRGVALLAAITLAGLMVTLSACQGSADESGFLRHVERAFDRSEATPTGDGQWWQANRDRVLSEGWASCNWLEGQPEFDDELQGPEQWMLRSQYLDESDSIDALGGSRRFNRTVVDLAWAELCMETRNSRTSLPPGVYED
jgi:hypothetical protein